MEDKGYNNEYDPDDNLIEEIFEKLNYCRLDLYKLYHKEFKVASVRLRHNLEFIIQASKQLKRDALAFRKELEDRQNGEEDEIWNG